jgi:hypothetical protein
MLTPPSKLNNQKSRRLANQIRLTGQFFRKTVQTQFWHKMAYGCRSNVAKMSQESDNLLKA